MHCFSLILLLSGTLFSMSFAMQHSHPPVYQPGHISNPDAKRKFGEEEEVAQSSLSYTVTSTNLHAAAHEFVPSAVPAVFLSINWFGGDDMRTLKKHK